MPGNLIASGAKITSVLGETKSSDMYAICLYTGQTLQVDLAYMSPCILCGVDVTIAKPDNQSSSATSQYIGVPLCRAARIKPDCSAPFNPLVSGEYHLQVTPEQQAKYQTSVIVR